MTKNNKPTLLNSELARQVRWLHATNPRRVQKIANMRMLMESYHAEWKHFLVQMAFMAGIGAVVVFPLCYYIPVIFSSGEVTRDADWWIVAIVVWMVLLVPPIMMMKPERPTEKDILEAIALRQQVGMDDSVAE